MGASLEWWSLESGQLEPVVVFVPAASHFGFAILLWWINKGTPNPTAPAPFILPTDDDPE